MLLLRRLPFGRSLPWGRAASITSSASSPSQGEGRGTGGGAADPRGIGKQGASGPVRRRLTRDWTLPTDLHSKSAGRRLDVFKFTPDGNYARESLPLVQVLDTCGLHARDLLSLERQNVATIHPRAKAIVLALSHVRAVIQADELLVFNPDRPAVLDFVKGMSEYLAVCEDMQRETREYDAIQHELHGTERHPPQENLAFELIVLEGILSSVSQKYQRRIQSFEPVINDVLRNMRQQGGPGHATEHIHTLLPLRNSLSRFERSNEAVVRCLERLMNNDEDMARMHLSILSQQPQNSSDTVVDLSLHHDVELVVESYFRRFEDFYAEAFALRKNIEATQDTLELALDEFRNRLIRINVHAAMATVGLAVSTSIAGFFGMNLVSGVEEAPMLFWYVMMGATGGGAAIYAASVQRAFHGRRAQSRSAMGPDIDQIHTLMVSYYDMHDILLSHLESNGGESASITEEEFGALLEATTGQAVDKTETRRIFEVFDRDNDHKLDYRDCVKLMLALDLASGGE